MTSPLVGPPRHAVDALLQASLDEDLAAAGDITSSSVISASAVSTASIVARQQGVVAGLEESLRAFRLLDPSVSTEAHAADGDVVAAGTAIATVTGTSRSVLAAERTCLNLIGHLSGIATATHRLVSAVAHTRATVVDTRKTTPGLRALEKYAVRAGGGANHRFGLYDAILIKDNHIAAGGGVAATVRAARLSAGHTVKIEVEIEDIEQLEDAITSGADIVMLDNMTTDELSTAVAATDGRCLLEASGGVTAETIVAVAESGVDLVSVGWITHSAPGWDVALDFLV